MQLSWLDVQPGWVVASLEEQDLLKFMEQVRDEDIELVELAQIGFRSKAFGKGVLSPTENFALQFHEMVQDVLGIRE